MREGREGEGIQRKGTKGIINLGKDQEKVHGIEKGRDCGREGEMNQRR